MNQFAGHWNIEQAGDSSGETWNTAEHDWNAYGTHENWTYIAEYSMKTGGTSTLETHKTESNFRFVCTHMICL